MNMGEKMALGKRIGTAYTGVWVRASKNRVDPDGEPDISYVIVYRAWDKQTICKTIGRKSEGMTLQRAAEIRAALVREERQLRTDRVPPKPRKITEIQRTKTRYIGVYVRSAQKRLGTDGKLDICYDIVWRDRNGRTRYKKVGWKSEGFTIQDAVNIRAKVVQAERYPGQYQSPQLPQDVTLQEVWEQYQKIWLPNLKNKIKLESAYNVHIKKEFGSFYISEITTLKIEEFKQNLFTVVCLGGKKTLSPGSVRAILSVLRRILRKSVEWQLHKNVLPTIRLPKEDGVRERYLSYEEADKFLDGLQYISCQYYFIAKISLYTGMRLSEILDIRVNDIDLSAKIIHVDGKTGKRAAFISDKMLKDMLLLSSKSNNLIFCNDEGKRLHGSKVSRDFAEIINDLGFNKHIDNPMQKFVFHTLRHTFCSWLAIKGVPLYTIGKLVGHASVRMTERYAKLSPDAQRDAINLL